MIGRRTRSRVSAFIGLGIAATAFAMTGCGSSASEEATAAAPPSVEPAPEYDLEAIMRGLAATYDTTNEICAKAKRSWETVDDDDRRRLWSALQERMRLGNEYEAMLRAHPDWAPTACEWYAAVLQSRTADQARLTTTLKAPDGSSRWGRLLIDAAGSSEAGRAYAGWSGDAAGSPRNIHRACRHLGLIREE